MQMKPPSPLGSAVFDFVPNKQLMSQKSPHKSLSHKQLSKDFAKSCVFRADLVRSFSKSFSPISATIVAELKYGTHNWQQVCSKTFFHKHTLLIV